MRLGRRDTGCRTRMQFDETSLLLGDQLVETASIDHLSMFAQRCAERPDTRPGASSSAGDHVVTRLAVDVGHHPALRQRGSQGVAQGETRIDGGRTGGGDLGRGD